MLNDVFKEIISTPIISNPIGVPANKNEVQETIQPKIDRLNEELKKNES